MKRKNLEKAIIMGLLAASISVPVWAADVESGRLWPDANKTVENGNLIIKATDTMGIGYQGTVNVVNGDLTVIAGSNGVEAGYAQDATVNLLANNISIEAGQNGLYVGAEGGYGIVNIGSDERKVDSLNITAKGQGIDNKLGSVTIYGSENSAIEIITDSSQGIKENQDGIINENGQVVIEGGNIAVSAANGNGINNMSEKISIDASGSVTVTAKDEKTTDVDYAGIHNTKGTTEINAVDRIEVTGSRNGVFSESGIIQLNGGALNKVNADDDGIKAVGSDANVILNAKENIISVNDANHRDSVNGIYADENGQVDITSTEGDLQIKVETEGTHAHGINAGPVINDGNGGRVSLTTVKGNIVIDVIAGAPDATGGNVYGIQAQDDSTATLTSGNNVIITTKSQVVDTKSNNVIGVEAQYASRVDIDAAGYVYIDTNDKNSANYGIRANEEAAVIDITSKGKNTEGYGVVIKSSGAQSHGAFAQNASYNIDATNKGSGGGIYISADSAKAADALYVTAINQNSSGRLVADGDIVLSAYNDAAQYASTDYVAGIYTNAYGTAAATTEVTGKNIIVSAVSENSAAYGLYAFNGGGGNTVDVSGNDISVVSNGYKGYSYGVLSTNSDVDITAAGNTNISSTGYGVYAWNNTGSDSINADITVNSAGSNDIYGYSMAVAAGGSNALADINSANGTNIMASEGTAVYATGSGVVNADAAATNLLIANTGVWAKSNGIIKLNAAKNYIAAEAYGIYADDGDVALQSQANILNVAVDDLGYGSGHAVQAANTATVNLNASNGDNVLAGVIYAKDDGTVVNLNHSVTDAAGNVVSAGTGSNYIYSSAHGSTDTVGDRSHVVAALYAQNQGEINIIAGEGGRNYIESYYEDLDSNNAESERTIWAQQGGRINIDGLTTIVNSNPNADTNNIDGNSYGIAVTAGTGETDFEKINNFNIDDNLRSTVNINYLDGTDEDGNVIKSSITGDIVSGYGGLINISALEEKTRASSTSGIVFNGNALAANGGKLNLDLGNGGIWTGRADDYGDAGVIDSDNHTSFFDPAFSNEIVQGGQVNLTMGEGSRWNVNGQSWITSINTGNSDITTGTPIIDLVNANTDRNTTAHALTVYELDGNAIFNMSLDGDRDVSDMLYIKNANGEYVVNVADAVSVDDMYQDGFNGLRFATVGEGSNASFRAITYNQGINNVEYEVGTDAYEGNEENDAYNSANGDGNMNSEKPGTDMVDGFFESTGTPDNPQGIETNAIMVLAETEAEADTVIDGTTNFKLIGVKNSEISDAGKTVVAMSKVNYSNAVYMDRLNKRLGEARYINSDEDQGVWVRLRHDRTGKSGEFRSMNTMYEIGYDEKQECDNGERRVGAAIDYMDGSAEYSNVAGTGDIKRRGIWLYDTWMGDKGHYADYVAKWGHLDNDFKLYRDGQKITGDYSNNVYSISAEYGRKKDIGNDWYFEPQAQLQYARVTGASYTTSQGTEVDLDAINSLIARAGFRLGKDLSERSTVYFKADVLHEFLGDQDIYAHDATGEMDVTYGNEGTWCDVGFGFAAAMSKTSYAYLDFEKSFGNDNDETYQINAGMQWSF